MKLFVICSKHFYDRVPPIKEELERLGHEVTLPNSYDAPFKEEEMKLEGKEAHAEWKGAMMKKQIPKIEANDAVLALNFEKKGQQNYIGGATFMEIIQAWERNKGIYLYNPIPDSSFKDELTAMNPTILYGNLEMITNGHSS